MSDLNEQFATIMAEVMKEKGVSLDQLRGKAPPGFWGQVAQHLNDRAIKSETGERWGGLGASQYRKQHREEISTLISQYGEGATPEQELPGEGEPLPEDDRPPAAFITRPEFQAAIEEMKEMIERVKAGIEIGQTAQKVSEERPALSPAPPLAGKKMTVQRSKLGVTIDRILMEKLEEESKKRGISMSRMVDTVVWYYFGKPPLSFQQKE